MMLDLTYSPFSSISPKFSLEARFEEELSPVRPLILLAICELSNYTLQQIQSAWSEFQAIAKTIAVNPSFLTYGDTLKIHDQCRNLFKSKKIYLKPHHIFPLIAISQAELVQQCKYDPHPGVAKTMLIISGFSNQIRSIEWTMNRYREFHKNAKAAQVRISNKYQLAKEYVEAQYPLRVGEWVTKTAAARGLFKEIKSLKLGVLTESNAVRTIREWINAIPLAR